MVKSWVKAEKEKWTAVIFRPIGCTDLKYIFVETAVVPPSSGAEVSDTVGSDKTNVPLTINIFNNLAASMNRTLFHYQNRSVKTPNAFSHFPDTLVSLKFT